MKTEYYLVYRTSKGDENSESEAILLGDLPTELLVALEIDIKENNTHDDVGEIILDKKRNLSLREKERLDDLTLNRLWNLGLGTGNPALSRLKNYYLKCSIGRDEAECWEIMTGSPHPPDRYVSPVAEEIKWTKNVIASISECPEVEYALRLIRLYERWLFPTENRGSFTTREMFLFFRRCLAWARSDYSDKKIVDLLKSLRPKREELIQPQEEQDSNSEEIYYELTNLGRVRAAGSLIFLPFQLFGHIENSAPAGLSNGSVGSAKCQGTSSLKLADLKPPSEKNGSWLSAKPKRYLAIYAFRRRKKAF
jgi:hypothetical protein